MGKTGALTLTVILDVDGTLVDTNLDLLDARELVDGWTTAADVERTKPHPGLVHAALEKAGERARP